MILRGSLTVRRLSPTPAVVIQAGTRTFVKDGGSYSPASIVVRAETRNVKEPVYEWGLLSDGSFTAVPSWTGDAITVLPEQAGVVMVKVLGSNITDPVTDYVDISVVEEGENGESLSGRMLHTDPTFKAGMNGVSKYSNAAAEVKALLVVERVERPEDAPTTSTHCLRVTCKAEQSPGFGGVYQTIQSRANAVFIQKVIAKLPEGYALNWAANSMGTGRVVKWLTPVAGTGKYETYLLKITCGAEGDFSTGGHLYVTGSPVPTEEAPLVWHIAYMTAFDQTDDGYEQIETSSKDALAEKLGYGSWKDMVDAVASSGSIMQGDYINSKLINVETLAADQAFIDKLLGNELEFKRGKIGGFAISAEKLYSGNDFGSGAGTYMQSKPGDMGFRVYRNTSNYVDMFYKDMSNWGIRGIRNGVQYFGLGMLNGAENNKIGGFAITSNSLIYSSDEVDFRLNNNGVYVYRDLGDSFGTEGEFNTNIAQYTINADHFVKSFVNIIVKRDDAEYNGLPAYDVDDMVGIKISVSGNHNGHYYDRGRNIAIWAQKGDIHVDDGNIKTQALFLNGKTMVSGSVKVDYKTSVLLLAGDITLTGVHGDGQLILIVNATGSKRYVRGLRYGDITILKYCCKFVYYQNGDFYPQSDEY